MILRICLLVLVFALAPWVSLAGNLDISGTLRVGGGEPDGMEVQLICPNDYKKSAPVDEDGRFRFQVPEESVCQTRVKISPKEASTIESIYFAEGSSRLHLELENKQGKWYLTSRVE